MKPKLELTANGDNVQNASFMAHCASLADERKDSIRAGCRGTGLTRSRSLDEAGTQAF